MRQYPLTIILPVKPEDLEGLRHLLEQMGDRQGKNPLVDFTRSPSTHFGRFVILERFGGPTPRLFFSTNHDGTFNDYCAELARTVGAGLDEVFQKCAEYEAGAAQQPERLAAFLRRHLYNPITFWVATPGISVGMIQESAQLRERLETALDQLATGAAPGSGMETLPAHLQEALRQALAQGQKPPRTPAAGETAYRQPPQGAPPIGGFWRFVERLVGVRPQAPTAIKGYRTRPELAAMEDRVVQNQMTVITPIRRELKHRVLLRVALWTINLAGKFLRGSLAGIPTIHFARWAIIDEGRHLLFESNYDGSWESYIDDFVDFASKWMNAIWANCEDFPLGGSRDVEHFKRYIRDHQVPAQTFYSAYKETTMKNKLMDLSVSGVDKSYMRQGDIERFFSGYSEDPLVLDFRLKSVQPPSGVSQPASQ